MGPASFRDCCGVGGAGHEQGLSPCYRLMGFSHLEIMDTDNKCWKSSCNWLFWMCSQGSRGKAVHTGLDYGT